jgi:uncharacterized protein (DUF2147 family)
VHWAIAFANLSSLVFMKKLFLLLCYVLISCLARSQSALGVWEAFDEATSEPRSHIEIYEKNGLLYGRIIKLLTDPADSKCHKCDGELKDKPVVGMLVIYGLTAIDGKWKEGNILDPENGTYYGCTIWLEPGHSDLLKVKGIHWTGLSRTQTWHRVK